MSGYPNQPPMNPGGIYPTAYHPVNGAPQQYPAPGYPGQPPAYQPAPGYPGQPAPGYQQPGPYPYQPGFAVGQPGQPGQPGHPAAMSYPGINPTPIVPTPTAPSYAYPGFPNVTPAQGFGNPIEWIPTTVRDASALGDRAVIGGYEGHDGSPLWVIRAHFEGDVIPGKLAVKHNAAYVAWDGRENPVQNIEVLCARPEKLKWQETSHGSIPPHAVVGGRTSSGEPLYVGRAKEQGSLTPGKVHPSHKVMYISFAGREIAHKQYEILCQVV